MSAAIIMDQLRKQDENPPPDIKAQHHHTCKVPKECSVRTMHCCAKCNAARFWDAQDLIKHTRRCIPAEIERKKHLMIECPYCCAWIAKDKAWGHMNNFADAHERNKDPGRQQLDEAERQADANENEVKCGVGMKRKRQRLRVIQINIQGLKGHRVELMKQLGDVDADIVVIQETWLTPEVAFGVAGWVVAARWDRTMGKKRNEKKHRGGGVMILIRDDIDYKEIKRPDHFRKLPMDVAAVDIFLHRMPTLRFVNCYAPPLGGHDDERVIDLSQELPKLKEWIADMEHTYICIDSNAHHAEWDDFGEENTRGQELHDWITAEGLITMNTGESTRWMREVGTAPDQTITHPLARAEWEVLDRWGSDHCAIQIDIALRGKSGRRRYKRQMKRAFHAADWDGYEGFLEEKAAGVIGELPNSDNDVNVDTLHGQIVNIMSEAARRFIPQGKMAREPKAWWNKEIDGCMRKRNNANATVQKARGDPNITEEKLAELADDAQQKRRECQKKIEEAKEKSWREYVEKTAASDKIADPYRLIRALDGNKRSATSRAALVNSKGKDVISDKDKANLFIDTYAEVARGKVNDAQHERRIAKEVRDRLRLPEEPESVVQADFEDDEEFKRRAKRRRQRRKAVEHERHALTIGELDRQLDELPKRKAAGEDEIANEMLQGMGKVARQLLLRLYNASWRQGRSPDKWKLAKVVPIAKPKKDLKLPGSYRPISLLSNIAKLMERIVLQRLKFNLGEKLHQAQAGFSRHRTTEEQIARISQTIYDGFTCAEIGKGRGQKERTSMVLVDFSRAYDRVFKYGLYKKMLDLELDCDLVKWTAHYLADRKAFVEYGSGKSKVRQFRDGLPQGSCLSPVLFIIFINDLAEKLGGGDVDVSLFADDLALLCTDTDLEKCEAKMQAALDGLCEWATINRMEISTEKTEQVLFTTAPKEVNGKRELDLRLRGKGMTKKVSIPHQQLYANGKVKMKLEDKGRLMIGEDDKAEWNARCKGRVLAKINGISVKTQAGVLTELRKIANLKKGARMVDVTLDTPVKFNLTPKFLGITMDGALSFKFHSQNTKAKTGKKTNAVRKMAGAQWGPGWKTLRTLHTGFVQSPLDYGLGVYGTFASDSSTTMVQRSQLVGDRVVTGCTKDTHVDIVLHEAGKIPVGMRADFRAAALYERVMRLAPDNGARRLAERPKTAKLQWPGQKSARTCWREQAKMISKDAGLEGLEREPLLMAAEIPPWVTPQGVRIVHDATGLGRDVPDDTRRQRAQSILRDLPKPHIFTDGSAEGGTTNGGAGFVVFTDRGVECEGKYAAGRFCSSYRAEQTALERAMDRILEDRDEAYVREAEGLTFLSDSQSTLRKLAGGPAAQDTVMTTRLWKKLIQICELTGKTVTLRYVPAHVGLEGNERADELAKEGTRLPQNNVPIDMSTAIGVLRQYTNARWQTRVRAERPVYAEITSGKIQRPPLPRYCERVIAQCRANHCPLFNEYLCKIRKADSPDCPYCPGSELGRPMDTPVHCIVECPKWSRVRLQVFGKPPSAQVLAQDPGAVVHFLEMIGRLGAAGGAKAR